MKMLYEILNNGAFVVTKSEKTNELVLGFYHDVFYQGDTMRIFEPLGPIKNFSIPGTSIAGEMPI